MNLRQVLDNVLPRATAVVLVGVLGLASATLRAAQPAAEWRVCAAEFSAAMGEPRYLVVSEPFDVSRGPDAIHRFLHERPWDAPLRALGDDAPEFAKITCSDPLPTRDAAVSYQRQAETAVAVRAKRVNSPLLVRRFPWDPVAAAARTVAETAEDIAHPDFKRWGAYGVLAEKQWWRDEEGGYARYRWIQPGRVLSVMRWYPDSSNRSEDRVIEWKEDRLGGKGYPYDLDYLPVHVTDPLNTNWNEEYITLAPSLDAFELRRTRVPTRHYVRATEAEFDAGTRAR